VCSVNHPWRAQSQQQRAAKQGFFLPSQRLADSQTRLGSPTSLVLLSCCREPREATLCRHRHTPARPQSRKPSIQKPFARHSNGIGSNRIDRPFGSHPKGLLAFAFESSSFNPIISKSSSSSSSLTNYVRLPPFPPLSHDSHHHDRHKNSVRGECQQPRSLDPSIQQQRAVCECAPQQLPASRSVSQSVSQSLRQAVHPVWCVRVPSRWNRSIDLEISRCNHPPTHSPRPPTHPHIINGSRRHAPSFSAWPCCCSFSCPPRRREQ
jgi:hypothetical protein